jgi:hypothetical protein
MMRSNPQALSMSPAAATAIMRSLLSNQPYHKPSSARSSWARNSPKPCMCPQMDDVKGTLQERLAKALKARDELMAKVS